MRQRLSPATRNKKSPPQRKEEKKRTRKRKERKIPLPVRPVLNPAQRARPASPLLCKANGGGISKTSRYFVSGCHPVGPNTKTPYPKRGQSSFALVKPSNSPTPLGWRRHDDLPSRPSAPTYPPLPCPFQCTFSHFCLSPLPRSPLLFCFFSLPCIDTTCPAAPPPSPGRTRIHAIHRKD